MELGSDLTKQVLDKWPHVDVRPDLREALRIIEKLVSTEDALDPDDVSRARAAGIDEEGLQTAIWICTAFSMIVRLADTFDFRLQTAPQYTADAKMLLSRGYGPEPA